MSHPPSLTCVAIWLMAGVGWMCAVARAQEPQTIDLKFTEEAGRPFLYDYRISKDGKLELPFANAAGVLKFEVIDGKLRADTNGDGVIDEKDDPAVEPNNVTIKVAAQVGGQTVRFPLFIQSLEKSDDPSFVVFSPRGMLQGTFAGQTIQLYADRNGHFAQDGTHMAVVKAGEDPRPRQVPWSPALDINGQLCRLELLGGGKQLKITPYTGPVAEVKLHVEGQNVAAEGMLQAIDNSQTSEVSDKQWAKFVPGQYRICWVCLSAPSGPDQSYAAGRSDPSATPIELKAGQNLLKVGGPFKLDFVASRDGDKVEFTAATIVGVAGESYRPTVSEKSGEICAAFIRAGGKEQLLTALEYG